MARLAWHWKRSRGDYALRVTEALVREGNVVLDIGASWGLYASRLARMAGPTGRVHAFEPLPVNWGSLEAIALGAPNVAIHRVALSDHNGEARLYIPVAEGRRIVTRASFAIPPDRSSVRHEVVPVRAARLDEVLGGAGPPVAFIKCDVEGHELAVLRGAETTLRRSLPALLVEIEQRHQTGDVRETFGYLAGLGYEGYSVRADGLRPLEQFDLEREQLAFLGPEYLAGDKPEGYTNDFLFVRPGTDLRRLLAPLGRA